MTTTIAPQVLPLTLFYHFPPFPLHCFPSYSLLALFTDLPAYGLSCSFDYAVLLLTMSFTCSYFYWAVYTLDNRPLLWSLIYLPSISFYNYITSVYIVLSQACFCSLFLLLKTTSHLANFYLSSMTLASLEKLFSTTEARSYVSLSCFSALFILFYFYTDFMAIICLCDFNLHYLFSLQSFFQYLFPLEPSIYLFIHYKIVLNYLLAEWISNYN